MFMLHDLYIEGHTYSAVSIKVLCDHKVHSAVIYSFTGVHLTAVLVKDLFVIFQGLSISFRLS